MSTDSNAELAARVAAAWEEYDSAAISDGATDDVQELYWTYRAVADELEQATGFAVTCGALTGRPAL